MKFAWSVFLSIGLLDLAGCGWSVTTFESMPGAYKINFPAAPIEKSAQVNTPAGPISIYTAMHEARDGSVYLVTYGVNPPAVVRNNTAKKLLGAGVEGMMRESGWSLVKNEPTSYHNHPGMDVEFTGKAPNSTKKLIGRVRVYLIGDRLYQVMSAGPEGSIDPASITAFLNSFTITREFPVLVKAESNRDQMENPAAANSTANAGATAEPSNAGESNAPRTGIGTAPSSRAPIGGRTAPRIARGPGGSRTIRPPVRNPSQGATPSGVPQSNQEAGSDGSGATNDRADSRVNSGKPAAGAASTNSNKPAAGAAIANGRDAGIAIKKFEWVNADEDQIGEGAKPDPDQHNDNRFRAELVLPNDAVIEEIAIDLGDGGSHKWTSKPSDRWWQVGILQNNKVITKKHVDVVGSFSGNQVFDLYVTNPGGFSENTKFTLKVVVASAGSSYEVTSSCLRRSASPDPASKPNSKAVVDSGAPLEPAMKSDPAKSGGASIKDFYWVNEDEDQIGTGSRPDPDHQKDLRFFVALDLPADTMIEEIRLFEGDGGFHNWITTPSDRYWQVAILQNGAPVAKSHVKQVGKFSGEQKFDLYVTNPGGLNAQSKFTVKIVVTIAGKKYELSASRARGEPRRSS